MNAHRVASSCVHGMFLYGWFCLLKFSAAALFFNAYFQESKKCSRSGDCNMSGCSNLEKTTKIKFCRSMPLVCLTKDHTRGLDRVVSHKIYTETLLALNGTK